MAKLKRREMEESIEDEDGFTITKPNWDFVTSTGSTLLDLAISGKRLPFGGVPSGILMEIAGASQSGKCVTRNNFIATKNGTYSIGEFFDSIGYPAYKVNKIVPMAKETVQLPNMFGECETVKALSFNGLRIIKKIKTLQGLEHEVTLNHPLKVVTRNGNVVWRNASDINVGDFLIVKTGTTKSSTEEDMRLLSKAYIAGLMVADGYLKEICNFTNNEPFLLKKVCSFLDRNEIRYNARERIKGGKYSTTEVHLTSISGSDRLRKELHLPRCLSAQKEVPVIFRTSGREVAISFLRGYFDCEAHFSNTIEVTSASKKLLMQVQQMLIGIGIVSSLNTKKVLKYNHNYYGRLCISGSHQDRFMNLVGTALISRKRQAAINTDARPSVRDIVPHQKQNYQDFISDVFVGKGSRESIKICGPVDRNLTFTQIEKVSKYIEDKNIRVGGWSREILSSWQTFARGGYFFSEVTETTILPEEDWTYDVAMENTHSFILNGCVSHNTLILTEMAARVQKKGGEVFFADPEDRLDKEYAAITGLNIRDRGRYERPDTVTELFDFYKNWEVSPEHMNIFCGDSLAALSTKMEMEDGDKMGMRRAKEFSEALRVSCRTFKKKNVLMVCSNQMRDGGPNGTKTIPGGNAVPFYSTVRLRCEPGYPKSKIKKEKTIRGAKHEKVIGVISSVLVHKNSLDDPWRKVPLHIVFGYGIDDIRANLTWYKESTNSKKFIVPGGIELPTIDKAIEYVEEADLAKKLRTDVRDLWREVENSFKQNRKPKEF